MCIASASSYQGLFLCKMFDESSPLMQLWQFSTILVLEEIQLKQILRANTKYLVSHVFSNLNPYEYLNGNKLARIWDITRHFLPVSLQTCSTLDGTILCVPYKKRITWGACVWMLPLLLSFKNLLTTGYYILSVKIMKKSSKKVFFSFYHVLCLYILLTIYGGLKSAHFPHANTQMPCRNWVQSIVNSSNMHVPISLCHCKPYAI